MHKPLSSTLVIAATALAAGCATPPPRPTGAIVPMAGGQFQSAVTGADPQQTLTIFTRDAEITCSKDEPKAFRMPWEPPPKRAKFSVVSQTMKYKDGKEIKSDNKLLDAGIAVGLRKLGLEDKDSLQITTVFKCD